MDSIKIKATWEEICEKVKGYETIDPMQINAFFSRLSPQVMSEGFIMLTTDNSFIKNWIEKHYIEYIQQALQEMYNIPYTVAIEIDISKEEGSTLENTPVHDQGEVLIQPVAPSESSQPKTNQTDNKPKIGPIALVEQNENKPSFTLTFENFVIGDSNRMAYSMAVAVAEMPGKAHLNPLFIYGKSGLGKTHLLRAIQNYLSEALPHLKSVYVDSAELLNDYTEASAAHDKEKLSFKNFKTRYEEADVLLIDDIQFFQGKKQTLDIVFQMFNKLTGEGKQVVLSADRAPKNIDIDERYKSRFNSGGTFDIQPPEIETKLGIIKSFIEEYKVNEQRNNIEISEDIQTYIAENSSSNIRELKSAVTKVLYQIIYSQRTTIELDEVRSLLENHFSGGASKRLTIADIQKEVESFYKINHSDLIGKKRTSNITYARHVGIYLCRQLLDLPFNDIGKKFNRDHSTVMYSVNIIEEKIKENRDLREEIEAIKQQIKDM